MRRSLLRLARAVVFLIFLPFFFCLLFVYIVVVLLGGMLDGIDEAWGEK